MILLAPLDKATLEIRLGFEQSRHFQVVGKDIVYKQSIDKVIALVEVYGTHHSLKGVAVDMLLRRYIR
jgi:hypothetical protein